MLENKTNKLSTIPQNIQNQISILRLKSTTLDSIINAYHQLIDNDVKLVNGVFLSRNKQHNILIHYLCSECGNEAKSMLFNFNKKLVYGCTKCNAKLINRITKTIVYLSKVNSGETFTKNEFTEYKNSLKDKRALSKSFNQRKERSIKSSSVSKSYQRQPIDYKQSLISIQKDLKDIGFRFVAGFEIIKGSAIFRVECPLGHISIIKGHKVPQNHFCKKCYPNTSYGELVLKSILEQFYNLEFHKVRPDWLMGKKNHLELDLYNDKLKIAFEYNGVGHYKPIYGLKRLNIQIENDLIKRQRCEELGVKLYIIKDLMNGTRNNHTLFNNIIKQLKDYGIQVNHSVIIQKPLMSNKITEVLEKNNKQLVKIIYSDAQFRNNKFLVKCISCGSEDIISGGYIQNMRHFIQNGCKICCKNIDILDRFKKACHEHNRVFVRAFDFNLEVRKRKIQVKCLVCESEYIIPGSILYSCSNQFPQCPICKKNDMTTKINNKLKKINKEIVGILKKENFIRDTQFLIRCLNCKTTSTMIGGSILKLTKEKNKCHGCPKELKLNVNDLSKILLKNNKILIEGEHGSHQNKFLIRCLNCNNEYQLSGSTIQNYKRHPRLFCPRCCNRVSNSSKFSKVY